MNQINYLVNEECKRQQKLWGNQLYPLVDEVLLNRQGGCTAYRMAEEYEICCEERAKALVQIAAEQNQLTWIHVVVEELTETIAAATTGDLIATKKEAIQTMAVLQSMIKHIDNIMQDEADDIESGQCLVGINAQYKVEIDRAAIAIIVANNRSMGIETFDEISAYIATEFNNSHVCTFEGREGKKHYKSIEGVGNFVMLECGYLWRCDLGHDADNKFIPPIYITNEMDDETVTLEKTDATDLG